MEVYDITPEDEANLVNISTRGLVRTGQDVLIGGFIISGTEPLRVLLRAIGPSMQRNLYYERALEDPTVDLYDQNGALIGRNDNWRSNQEAEIRATPIPPEDDRESAILTELTPAAYTAIVRGVNDTSGLGLVEVYALN